MKKFVFLFIVLIISACLSPSGGTPQVTVTSEVTVTLAPPTQTPIPTPTLNPEFIAWQELISSSGRYTLTPNGFIQENGIAISGLQVDSDGIMTLTVNNEKIILTLNDVTFDDENGLIIEGYELNDEGEWVEAMSEAMDTIMLGKVTLTLSKPDENGVQVATKIEVKGNYSDEEKIDELKQVDPKYYGFNPGEVEIVVVDDQIILTPTGEHETEIARWFFGTNEWLWHWDQLEQLKGGNPVFETAKLWEMNGVNEVDREGAKADDKLIYHFSNTDPTMRGHGVLSRAIYLYSADGKAVIGAILKSRGESAKVDMTPEIAASGEIDGVIYFIKANGELMRMKVDNLSFRIRYWRYSDLVP